MQSRFAAFTNVFRIGSYGDLSITYTIVVGPLRAPLATSGYINDAGLLMNDAKTLVAAQGYDSTQYDWFGIGFPTFYNWGGLASAGGSKGYFWINGGYSGNRVFLHEVGHTLGLAHATVSKCTLAKPWRDASCSVDDQADYADAMVRNAD